MDKSGGGVYAFVASRQDGKTQQKTIRVRGNSD